MLKDEKNVMSVHLRLARCLRMNLGEASQSHNKTLPVDNWLYVQ
jgi:hypothetical protein